MNPQEIEFWQVLAVSSLRYFVFAGITYIIFYTWKTENWILYKIQKKLPQVNAIRTEVMYSMITLLIFACVIYGLLFTPIRDYTKVYAGIHEHSVFYFFLSLFIVIFIHDTYFYVTHRVMHWKKIFPYIHKIHHRSHNPTPLAAFSFHPLEAIIEIGVLPLIAFTIPLHRGVIALFSLYMMTMNVIGHLGFEFFPAWFLRNKWSRWLSTSTHHNMHHRYGKGNYGLYFNLWDRVFKTNHPDYEKEYNNAIRRRDASGNTVH